MARWTSRLTTVTLRDSGGVNSITAGPSPGDLSIDNIVEGNTEKIKKLNRGVHDGFVEGDDLVQACSLSIELKREEMTSGVAARIVDFLLKTGTFSAANSKDATIWAWETLVTMTDGSITTSITMPLCEGGLALAEGKEGHVLTLSFRNHQAPVFA